MALLNELRVELVGRCIGQNCVYEKHFCSFYKKFVFYLELFWPFFFIFILHNAYDIYQFTENCICMFIVAVFKEFNCSSNSHFCPLNLS